MHIRYIAVNSLTEDTEIVPVNANTLKINGVYKVLDPSSVSFSSIQDDYVQGVTIQGSEYFVEVTRKYTQDNSAWAYKDFVDVTPEYTFEPVVSPTVISGGSQAQMDAAAKAANIEDVKRQLALLDTQVPRIVEELILSIPAFVPYPTKKAIIDQKVSLRAQLAELGG